MKREKQTVVFGHDGQEKSQGIDVDSARKIPSSNLGGGIEQKCSVENRFINSTEY
jgi:hypothetical protein